MPPAVSMDPATPPPDTAIPTTDPPTDLPGPFPEVYDSDALTSIEAKILPDKLARFRRTYTYQQPCFAKAADLQSLLAIMIVLCTHLATSLPMLCSIIPSGCVEDAELSYFMLRS